MQGKITPRLLVAWMCTLKLPSQQIIDPILFLFSPGIEYFSEAGGGKENRE